MRPSSGSTKTAASPIVKDQNLDLSGKCQMFTFDLDLYGLKLVTPLISRRIKTDGTHQIYKSLPKFQ